MFSTLIVIHKAYRGVRMRVNNFEGPTVWRRGDVSVPYRCSLNGAYKMHWIGEVFLVFLTVTLAEGQIFFACSPRACMEECKAVDCGAGRLIDNATTCGCCPICVKTQADGSPCHNTEIASLPSQECGHSMTCSKGRCTLQTSKPCVRELQEELKKGPGFEMAYGRPAPDCDFFGDYRPKRCKKGLMCHCVGDGGERIFGTALHQEAEGMNCNCSRLAAQQEALDLNAAQRLRCLRNGNLDPLQCTDAYCFCLKEDGSLDGEPVPRRNSLLSLPCVMKDQRYDDMMPRCIVDFLNLTAMEKEMRSDNDTTLVGMDTPYCDPDGSYAPKQCKDDRCYCVRPDGRPYDNQDTVPRYSVEEQEMTCNCLREKELLSNAEVPMTMLIRTFLRHRCARNGNYLHSNAPRSRLVDASTRTASRTLRTSWCPSDTVCPATRESTTGTFARKSKNSSDGVSRCRFSVD
ncbi:uncharacterized protein LOC135386259 [Ornithodoros turicata]|uniref:uncharacterized protein LOC135386259 n=1 Tax=Ornithodoros turicata TaxID=34597 RepID=UPI00313A4916